MGPLNVFQKQMFGIVFLDFIDFFDFWTFDLCRILGYLIIGLLDFWIIAFLDYWIIGLLAFGTSGFHIVSQDRLFQ